MVWIRGDHDPATRVHLSATITLAALVDDADLVVDLSGVTFMDASTIDAIVDAHNHLREHAVSLAVRAPSPLARRLLAVCRLGFLIEEHPPPARPSTALDSWVAVPASERASPPEPATASEKVPSEETTRAETTRAARPRREEPAGSVEQRRTLS